ncbi:Z1 domain-containing protein [Roseovarius halotolerans]|uniref:Z1 domain protein n=1 Tax=Roseovarius halotolerans TaxID=505353 RepID=A0A1X6ZZ33_9RHOB|nr:Z1 domain-containing protein [Roseovarius halotolerans]RKT24333.1 Z1 domain-containing protein [Roseovarius halotolerans]SLN65403.1 Z1 domain protein [Roseovarius halotolerans]
MSEAIETVKNMVESGLFNQARKTEDELRSMIRGVAALVPPGLSDEEIEQIAREIEHKQGIKAGLGAVVDSEDFEPWLDDAKPSIEPFYWNRYQKLLLQNGLPKDVVISTDTVTDKILSRLGNPEKHVPWDRRGMVVGHVQSGKTANYAGLICKAADAGYRLIIVIAGIHNNLRNQTQARIDEGFIGRDTGKSQETKKGGAKHIIGVGHFDPNNTPVSLTNTLRDFNKATASTNTSEIDSYKVPVVLVIKKNHRTLANLLDWLKDNSARGDQEMIDQPMLLIDDEADNASINTKYGKKLVTTINGQIRDLLNMFHRSCYVGYTATPFANIFIDPDQDDEMYNEDLFPRDFIIGLDAPTNYFGPTKIFVDGLPEEGDPTWLRYITDNEDILPVKHKIDHELDALPSSLTRALRAFLLARTIRNMRGQKRAHCSMLVNASRFTAVQGRLRNRLHETLERIQNSVRINASRGAAALNDPEIAALHGVWREEYPDVEFDWPSIQSELLDALASAKIVEVNSRANDLDYSNSGERGQTVVAVGGFSLSRGLTLEGLTVTWFLRNTMMYDTLMQMGRWFGYRGGYEDLCRIWMPAEAIDWYSFIATAAEELHDELRTMEKAKATPRMFGLAVRSHPASLLVTARNKMGSGKKVTTLVGLSNKFVETSKVSIKPSDLSANLGLAKSLVSKLNGASLREESSPWGTLVRGAPVEFIDEFLAGWRNAEQSVTTDPGPVRSYIRARKADELQTWDILIPSLAKGLPDMALGKPIVPATRYVDLHDLQHEFMSFSGKRMRVASRGIEKAGVDPARADAAEARYREEKGKADGERVNYPDSIYRRERDRGLFILHFVKAKAPDGKEDAKEVSLIPDDPVVAWGISLPVSSRPAERVEYVVNTVRYQELFGEDDEDDDQEAALEAL